MSADLLCQVASTILQRPINEADLVPVLRQVRFERIARLLHLRIARLAQPAERTLAASLIDALDDEQAQSLLQSPALCELLRTGAPAASLLFLLACAGEPGRPAGPSLANGIALEALPARLANPSAGLQSPAIPGPDAEAAAIAQIDAALRHLKTVSPVGHTVFAGLVQSLVVREDSARARECWGASSGAAIGRVAVINPSACSSPAALAEVLLHEATHCAIDCAELVAPLVPLDAAHGPLIASPWSGNPLTAHAFIHASVVWAVLHGYWQSCASEPGASRRLHYIEQGFAALNELRPGHLPELQPCAAAVIRLASDKVLVYAMN